MSDHFFSTLVEVGLLKDCSAMRCTKCRRSNCLYWTTRSRNLSQANFAKALEKDEDPYSIPCIRCNKFKTLISPRADSFFCSHWPSRTGKCQALLWKKDADNFSLVHGEILDWLPDVLRSHRFITCGLHNFLRELATKEFDLREKFGGPGHIIQADESLLHGKRKSNRGRLLMFEHLLRTAGRTVLPNVQGGRRNHGNRANGPWLLGLADCIREETGKLKILEVRVFFVPDRTQNTLLPVFKNECLPGSVIHTDEWLGYSRLPDCCDETGESSGFIHQVVNHNEHFVAPNGVHTQNIESVWGQLKVKLLKTWRTFLSQQLHHTWPNFGLGRNTLEAWISFLKFWGWLEDSIHLINFFFYLSSLIN